MPAPTYVDRFPSFPRINRLDRTNPLTKGLLFYVVVDGYRIPFDLVGGHTGALEAGTISYSMTRAGPVITVTNGRLLWGPTAFDRLNTSDGQMATVSNMLSQPSTLVFGSLAATGQEVKMIHTDTSGVIDGLRFNCNNGVQVNSAPNFLPTNHNDRLNILGVGWTGSGTTFRAQGQAKSTTSAQGSLPVTASASRRTIFPGSRTTQTATGQFRILAAWDHALSDVEWALFEQDPDLRVTRNDDVFAVPGVVPPADNVGDILGRYGGTVGSSVVLPKGL